MNEIFFTAILEICFCFFFNREHGIIITIIDIVAITTQRGVANYRFTNTFLLLSLLLIVIVNCYLGIVTSIFTEKPVEKGFTTASQLLQQNYRMLIPTPAENIVALLNTNEHYKNRLKELGIAITLELFVYLNATHIQPHGLEYIRKMAENKAFSHLFKVEFDMFKFNPFTRQLEMGSYRCFVLGENQRLTSQYGMGFHLYLAEKAGKLFSLLRENGLYTYWLNFNELRKFQRDRGLQINLSEGKEMAKRADPIPLESQIQIVFFFWIICIGVCGVVFLWKFATSIKI